MESIDNTPDPPAWVLLSDFPWSLRQQPARVQAGPLAAVGEWHKIWCGMAVGWGSEKMRREMNRSAWSWPRLLAALASANFGVDSG